MDGFKTTQKMQHFKEGGSVKYKSRHSEKTEMKEDVKQDKAVVKKAVKMHDEQLHEGKETNLSKLKKGGRTKKEGGCVGRYKSGGGVSYGAKKTEQDIKDIAAIKRMKPKMKADGGMVTDEERARMPKGKLPQQTTDELALQENTEAREMVAGPLRKLKKTFTDVFKKKETTPMKKGGKACQ